MSGHAYFRPPSNTFAGRNNSNNQLFQTYPPQALIWHPMVLNPFNLGNANVFYNAATPAPQYCLRPVYTRTFSPIQSSNNLHLNLHSFNDPLLSSINLNPNLFSNLRSRFGMNTTTDDIVTLQSESCEETTKFGEKRKHDDDNDLKDRKKVRQETKALKAKRPGFTEERYNETSYYVENSLRKVHPYYFTFTTFCKGRWVGQPILEIFAREFRAHPPEEYERSIKSGAITVNYKKVDVTYKLQHNDLLANTVHRHEVPVANFPIEILHECDDLVVVDKPPSIPVHPCGRYRHNTVVFILAKEFNLKNLRTIHRLDRLTSGILLFGRSLKKARQLEHEIRSRLVKKEYVCRVVGEFPTEIICCEEPIEVVSYKIGVCRVGPNGKQCKTHFQRLSYNGETSVVLCKPLTGRMHQIRVHLQYLGYPIVNDPLYNHSVFGPERGKGGRIGKTNEELTAELIRIHNAENWLGVDIEEGNEFILPKQETAEIIPKDLNEIPPVKDDVVSNNSVDEDKKLEAAVAPSSCDDSDSVKMVKDVNCSECKVKYKDPKPEDLIMYLHAWRYEGPDWKFETKLPDWANEN